jgi:glutathione synthase/RimK-type ligase-like ATP-grasp enzyme
MGLGRLLRSVDCLWVNHPENMVSADYKPYQLKVAGECGLEIPASLITNDSRAVLDFFERCKGEMIYKTLSGGMIVAESGEVVSVYTSRVTRDDLRDGGGRVRYTACLFQELVPNKVELRITVVGDRVFPAEISYAHPERATIDWRTAFQDLQYGIYELPMEVHRKCLELGHKLGLSFAAIDMMYVRYNQSFLTLVHMFVVLFRQGSYERRIIWKASAGNFIHWSLGMNAHAPGSPSRPIYSWQLLRLTRMAEASMTI